MNLVVVAAGLFTMWLLCLVVVAGVWMLTETFGRRAESAVERFDRGEFR